MAELQSLNGGRCVESLSLTPNECCGGRKKSSEVDPRSAGRSGHTRLRSGESDGYARYQHATFGKF